ncbi:MAG: hypothetical protein H6551_11145 [Chitinophagales bacterium]|nr:hypothetical protein [Chitinophagales bacterium]
MLVFIFFSRELSQADYGTYQNFWVQLFLLGSIATIGIPAFVLTYSPVFVREMLGKLTTGSYFKILFWVLVVASVFAWLRHEDAGLEWYVSAGFFIVYALNAIAEAMLIVFKRFTYLMGVNLFYTFLFIWLHWGVLQDSYSMSDLFMYLLLLGVIRLVVSFGTVKSHLRTVTGIPEEEYTLADIRSLWKHIGIYDVFNRFITWIDKFVVSLIFTSSISAVYFNATYDIPFLPLLLGAVGGAALMQMSTHAKADSDTGAINVANNMARLLSSVVFPLFFFLFIFRAELFEVLLKAKYAESVPIFAVTVFIVPLRAYNFTSILQNRHKGRVINTGALLDAVIAFGLMYPLYQMYDLLGIALSFVISSYVQGAYYLYHTAKLLKVGILDIVPFVNWRNKIAIFGVLFVVLHYLSSIQLSSSIVLLLGCIALVISVMVTLLIELKASRKNHGATVSQSVD